MFSKSFINKVSCYVSEELKEDFKRVHSHLTDIEHISTKRLSRLRERTESISSRVDDIEKALSEKDKAESIVSTEAYRKAQRGLNENFKSFVENMECVNSREKKCSTCKWFKSYKEILSTNPVGSCQKNSPSNGPSGVGFPIVVSSDKCGEWEADKCQS